MGRGIGRGYKNCVQMTVRLSSKEFAALEKRQAESGKSRADVLRAAVTHECDGEPVEIVECHPQIGSWRSKGNLRQDGSVNWVSSEPDDPKARAHCDRLAAEHAEA